MGRRSDHADKTVRRKKLYSLPNGKRVEIQALGLSDFVQARDEALAQYKRHRLQTWTANVDLLPESERRAMIRDAFERAELLTVDDLPVKIMKMPVRRKDGRFARDEHGQLIPHDQEVEYAAWWMSETPEGRLFMTWLSIRRSDPTFTIADADEVFKAHIEELEKIADEIGEMSGSSLGNSSQPPAEPEPVAEQTAETKRLSRRQRRRQIGR